MNPPNASDRRPWSIDPDLDTFELEPEDLQPSIPLKKVPVGDIFEAARAGDVDRLRHLLDTGIVNVNARDSWDSVALYYACLAGHVEVARMLLEAGAICSERTFDGDRCHYAALNLRVTRILKAFEARPPPLGPLPGALRDTFLGCQAYRAAYFEQCEEGSATLDNKVDDMEDLVRTCKACKCEELQKILREELFRQTHSEYKSLREVDNSQKRFILQGLSLPEKDRLPSALHRILEISLANSSKDNVTPSDNDLADVCIKVCKRTFRCHQVILASRSEYFKARLSRMTDFLEGNDGLQSKSLPFLEEHDLSTDAFEKMIEYMYTDGLKDLDPDQAEEMFDAASRYLLFPLKRAATDVLLPHLQIVSPAEMCHWLILSDMYGVLKIREHCLDAIACNFEAFADTREFQAMLLTLPPPSGDSSLRTTRPSAPGSTGQSDQGNILDDLRDKWLEAEAAELDKRDESAALFDKRLEMLMLVAEQEIGDANHDQAESKHFGSE